MFTSKSSHSDQEGSTTMTTTVPALYINDNGRTLCAEHAGSYLTAAIATNPTAPIHFTPLGSWLRTTDPSPYGCEDCGAIIPGADPEPVDPRDVCTAHHTDAVVGEVSLHGSGSRQSSLPRSAARWCSLSRSTVPSPSALTPAFLKRLTGPMTTAEEPLSRPCEECGTEAGEPCRVYCTAQPETDEARDTNTTHSKGEA